MTKRPSKNPKSTNAPGRHEKQCRICAHPLRQEIEEAFVAWISAKRIAKEYKVSRAAIYRHATVFGLLDRRRRNVRAALEKIIEHASDVEVNAAAVVSAVAAYTRINAKGEWVVRSQSVNLNELFERMALNEMEAYAKDGTLPDWFTAAIGETASVSREDANGG